MLNNIFRTKENDRLDQICAKYYAKEIRRSKMSPEEFLNIMVPQVLDANPGLAQYETFPAGITIRFPVAIMRVSEKRLWD